jgi:hypothetical protein
MKKMVKWSLPLIVLLVTVSCSNTSTAVRSTTAAIAVFADNQVGFPVWDATRITNPSSANLPQLRRTIADIASLPRPVDRTIFLGDLVMNEAEDNGATLAGQLDAWETAFRAIPGADKSALLPVAGNHELNTYYVAKKAQAPNPSMYDTWLAWTLRNGHEPPLANGPGPSGENPDMLVRDESMMSFSFNIRGIHVVVLNTDSLSTQIDTSVDLPVTGWIPIHWVEADIRAAQADPLVSAIVVMGHRPVEGMPGMGYMQGNSIHNSVAFPLADRLAKVMRENSKAKLYIASHMHSTDLRRIEDGKGIWQLISGNGGAPFEGDWNPPGGPYFGFAIVNFYPDGNVGVVLYQRPPPPPPQKFYEDSPIPPPPATPDPEIILERPAMERSSMALTIPRPLGGWPVSR